MKEDVRLIVENLRAALAIISFTPRYKIDLRYYAKETECGTIACAIGTLAMHPYFQEQGLELRDKDEGAYACFLKGGGVVEGGVDLLFGEHSFGRLFHLKNSGRWDEAILEDTPAISDKALAIERLKLQLAIYEGKLRNINNF